MWELVGLCPGGGGGHSQCILVGVCRDTSKKGGIRHGHEAKKGGLKLGMGTSRKRGVLRTGLVKKTILATDGAQKGVFWAYLLITLNFFLVNMTNWWGFTLDRLKKRGLRHGSGKKRGVLGMGQVKKGGLRHGSGSKKGGSWARVRSKKRFLYCGTYLYCPPPPPGGSCMIVSLGWCDNWWPPIYLVP